MSLQDHVPSFQLCEEWKKIGGRQDTEFYWRSIEPGMWFVDFKPFTDKYIFAAPLASELMEWMKDRIDIMHSLWRNEWIARDKTYANIYWTEKLIPNALMKMAIVLNKEEK